MRNERILNYVRSSTVPFFVGEVAKFQLDNNYSAWGYYELDANNANGLMEFEHDTIPIEHGVGLAIMGGGNFDEWIVRVGSETGSGTIRFVPVPRPGLDWTIQEEIVINFVVVTVEEYNSFLLLQ